MHPPIHLLSFRHSLFWALETSSEHKRQKYLILIGRLVYWEERNTNKINKFYGTSEVFIFTEVKKKKRKQERGMWSVGEWLRL